MYSANACVANILYYHVDCHLFFLILTILHVSQKLYYDVCKPICASGLVVYWLFFCLFLNLSHFLHYMESHS